MKWSILLSAGLIFSALDAASQQPDTAQVLVHYKFSHVRDTTNRGNPYMENMVLLVGKRAGAYRSYDFQLSVAQDKKRMKEAIANSAGGPVRINRQITGSGTEYFQYPNDRKMLRKESLFAYFLVTGALPVVNWQISGDTAWLKRMYPLAKRSIDYCIATWDPDHRGAPRLLVRTFPRRRVLL